MNNILSLTGYLSNISAIQVAAEPVSRAPTDTNRLMADTLKLMACQFRVYATHHEAKGDHDKAQTNASFAELAETVLALEKGGAK